MAKAAGAEGEARYPEQRPDVETLGVLVSRLEQLAQAQQVAPAVVLSDDPDHAAAFEQLFAAVALLNPLYAAAEIEKLVKSRDVSTGRTRGVRRTAGRPGL